jgi:flagellar biosynthetic protein FlhB
MPSDENGEKTEQATPRRRQKAVEEGNIAKSRELSTALSFIAAILFLYYYMPYFMQGIEKVFIQFFQMTDFDITPNSTYYILTVVVKYLAGLVIPFMALLVAVGIIANIVQFGFVISPKAMQPKFSRLDPIKGFSNLFSKRSLVELIKSLIKIFVVGAIAFFIVKGEISKIVSLASADPFSNMVFLGKLIFEISFKIAIVILLMAIADFIYQKWQHEEDLKMTKQEVKEEFKQMEGDPQVKQRIRSMQRDMARKRMMEDVPKSDVVVTNPTHYAVAIKYEAGTDSAPKVVAKGQRLIALRIKELAREKGVFIHEDPPLARSLFAASDIGEEIPENLYRAVAEILAMVYQIKGKT